MKRFRASWLLIACLPGLCCLAAEPAQAESMQFGFSKVEITPREPVRLAGYGNRDHAYEGVAQKLWTRALALKQPGGEVHVLVSVDSIGFPGVLTTAIARRLEQKHGISRERFVICCTHSHTTPHPDGYAPNLFALSLNLDEEAKLREYTIWLADRVVEGVEQAVADLAPGRLYRGMGKAGFAANRRVLKGGRWTGFGVNPDGPVDHSVPVLKVIGADGKLRGMVFNYACHCTTLTGDYYQVSGDWAGYAAEYLEETNAGTVALCTIGCGADANPEPRGEAVLAQAHGRALSIEVNRVLAGDMQEITATLTPSFGYAGLPIDRPELGELRAALAGDNPQAKRHAQNMLNVYERMGRLPESYPMPIETWQFGDELTMVFLGGEVVVDYARRLQQELGPQNVWVTAYANDVFGYVASERMRQEGGYEFDYSMIFYNQPGPWEVGTEEVIIERARQILANPHSEGALAPEQALKSFRLPEGFEIELVASEPLISDPVNFAFGPDGKLWVVEMGDYPRGEGQSGGKVLVLEDVDRDGRFDKSTTFIDGLSFPTGVYPWGKGALVSCAPEIFYAEDQDGDGRADVHRVLFEGFVESNPQHRINGFAHGLDNWLHLGSGASSGEIHSPISNQTVNIAGRDIRIRPDAGILDTEAGQTQFGRVRDDWGHWFGSENSEPIYHFVISDRYLRRNKYFPSPDPKVELLHPSPAPPVFPSSRLVDRFNDMWAANRFTSACAPTFFRDVTLGEEMARSALVCEPVHNLVHRTMIVDDGVTFRGERHPSEEHSEFLSSTDVWSRPVKVATGPDGALWMADMYRHVIEHPQWIPEEWQARLDLYAGADRGRIYRIYRSGQRPGALPRLSNLAPEELIAYLESPNGPLRDMAQELLVQGGDVKAVPFLAALVRTGKLPVTRMQALHTLAGMQALHKHEGLQPLDWALVNDALDDADARVQEQAIVVAESQLETHSELGEKLLALVEHPSMRLRMQLALTLGEWQDPRAGAALGQLALADIDNHWMRTAVLSSASHHAQAILHAAFERGEPSDEWSQLVQSLIATALGNDPQGGVPVILAAVTRPEVSEVAAWQMAALASLLDALARSQQDLAKLASSGNEQLGPLVAQTAKIFKAARAIAPNRDAALADRLSAVTLLGRDASERGADLERLGELLTPQTPPVLQSAAVAALGSLDSSHVPAILLDEWRGHSPRLQQEILSVLSSRRAWRRALLEALEAKQIRPADLDAATRERLLTQGSDESRERAKAALAAVASASREKVLADYQSVIGMSGNPIRGAEMFGRRCTTCHLFRTRGNKVGPDLAALQDKSARNIVTAVLDPNRAVEWGFRTYVAAMESGRVFNGMIIAESTNSVTLAEPDGRQHVLLRADLEELSETDRSFMPEGLEQDLNPQDLADVIAFLQSGPLPLGSVDRETAAANARNLQAAGGLGIGEVTSADLRAEGGSWLGPVAIASCSASTSGSHRLVWRTPPQSADLDPALRHLLRVPIVLGIEGGGRPHLELQVGAAPLLDFELGFNDASWSSADGRVVVRYLAMEMGREQGGGLLEIELPGDLLRPGEPVEVALSLKSASGQVGLLLPE